MSESSDKVIRQFLTQVENHHLVNLLLAEYTASNMTDVEFAEYAMTKITLRPGTLIKDHTIKARRDQFKIAANKVKIVVHESGPDATMVLAHEQQIKDLMERVAMLEGWVNTTFPNRSGKKVV